MTAPASGSRYGSVAECPSTIVRISEHLLLKHAGNRSSVPTAVHPISIVARPGNVHSIEAGGISPAILILAAKVSFAEIVITDVAGRGGWSGDGCVR